MKHNFTEAKKNYQKIPVPPELESMLKQSIAQAKADMEQENHTPGTHQKKASTNPRFRRYALRGTGTAAAAVFAIALLANSSASISHAMKDIPIIGVIAQVVTFREYQHKENNMEADLKIPEVQVKDKDGIILEDSSKELNDAIQSYTDEIIAAYEADVKAAGSEGLENISLDYDVVTDNPSLFSLRFEQCVTMAGASQSQKIYHIDKSTGKMISLKDLFKENADYQTVISDNIKTQMKQQMTEDENKIYWLNSDTPEWDFTAIPSDVNFYVNQSGKLNIVFDEYQVAPGFMGIVTFEIPTEILKPIVKEGYLD